MLCKKHGRSGFHETCVHVDAYFRSGKYKEFHLPEFWIHTLVCDDCYNRYNVAKYEKHPEIADKDLIDIDEEQPIVKEFMDIYNNMQRRIWCSKCLAELREKS